MTRRGRAVLKAALTKKHTMCTTVHIQEWMTADPRARGHIHVCVHARDYSVGDHHDHHIDLVGFGGTNSLEIEVHACLGYFGNDYCAWVLVAPFYS
jgi:hypothetical protein